jgi:hypothetical protein
MESGTGSQWIPFDFDSDFDNDFDEMSGEEAESLQANRTARSLRFR